MKILSFYLLITTSLSFGSYYSIGDTLDYEIHNPSMEICAGDSSGDTIFLCQRDRRWFSTCFSESIIGYINL